MWGGKECECYHLHFKNYELGQRINLFLDSEKSIDVKPKIKV